MHLCITLCTIDISMKNQNVEFNFMAVFFNESSLDPDHCYEYGLLFNMIKSSDQECCWIGDVPRTFIKQHPDRSQKSNKIL